MKDRSDLSERFLGFAADAIKLLVHLKSSETARHIGKQLLRSSTSAGANYEEACGAESKRDFIHKLQIVLKELRESLYWLRLIKKIELANGNRLNKLLTEADELARIIGKSIVTSRKNK